MARANSRSGKFSLRHSEIRQRLDDQIELAGWLQRAAMPNDATLYGSSPQFMLLATALGAHVGKLRELRSLI